MKKEEFIKMLVKTSELKTLYVKGGFGHPLSEKNKKRLVDQYAYNEKIRASIMGASDDTFAFDCCGLIKGVIWGFKGDKTKVYGGAKYESNGLSDVNEKGLLNLCSNISDDFTSVSPGDFLYMSGHCGIYIGNGNVIESSPKWKNGVQVTELNARKWKTHGRLPFIEYTPGEDKKEIYIIPAYYLSRGSMGPSVKNLQTCLNKAMNAGLTVDGIFGPLTKQALKNFQTKYNLSVDGIYGPQSRNKLMEVLS